MTLREIVEKYRTLAGGFGLPVPLADFGFAHEETVRIFSVFDEDYHISRFFHFTLDPAPEHVPGRAYRINSFLQSHVAIDAEIAGIL